MAISWCQSYTAYRPVQRCGGWESFPAEFGVGRTLWKNLNDTGASAALTVNNQGHTGLLFPIRRSEVSRETARKHTTLLNHSKQLAELS